MIGDKGTKRARRVAFDQSELSLMREWYDAVCDLNPAYLNPADHLLGIRITKAVGLRPSTNSILSAQAALPSPPRV